ncbi:MAG: ATP synthase F1 subunit epsilon [Clostridiales bacterium]|jgi:F-type H+-transporting ATPase subunit epsilon|nr:ATP synthase F1 subunit epsilon [Clostridiales bacterium]
MNTFNMHIYAADKPFYSGPCESLVVPSLDGTYGIWANHSNIIIAIIPGSLIYRLPGQQDEVVAVSHGLVKVENNDVLVLVDSLERLDEIDTNRAQRAADAAREALLQNKSMQEFRIAQAHLARALNRLRVKGNYSLHQGWDKK